jgi:hypothetical protein
MSATFSKALHGSMENTNEVRIYRINRIKPTLYENYVLNPLLLYENYILNPLLLLNPIMHNAYDIGVDDEGCNALYAIMCIKPSSSI